MLYIDYDYKNLKIGEKLCYHIGNLARDRNDTLPGTLKRTNQSKLLNQIAKELYKRSTAVDGTGEFALIQKTLEFDRFAYIAIRVKASGKMSVLNI